MQRESKGPRREAEQEDGEFGLFQEEHQDGQAPQDSRHVIDGPWPLPPAHQTEHGVLHVVRAVPTFQGNT